MKMRIILPALVLATILLSNGISSVQGKEFVLVHGAAQGAWVWFKVATLLRKAGHKATALDLASAGTRDKISADSITTLAQLNQPLFDYLANSVSDQVVLVAHSCGGISVTVALEEYPTKISHAIFLAGVMPANNQSVLGSVPPSFLSRTLSHQLFSFNFANGPSSPATSITMNLTTVPSFFYNKSPPAEIALGLSLFSDVPYPPNNEVVTLTPERYGSVPRYYVQTDDDNVWGPGGQEFIIANNPPLQTFFIEGSDHSSFFSKPLATALRFIEISEL